MVATPGSITVNFVGQGGRSPDRSVATWREEFFAYGRSSDRRDARNRYRFLGVERDEDTGLCVTGPRTYDPIVGRFLQGDPVVGGAAYVYSRGNPLTRLDDNGYADTPATSDAPPLTSDAWTPSRPPNENLKVPLDQQQPLAADGVELPGFVGPPPPGTKPALDYWRSYGENGHDCMQASRATAGALGVRVPDARSEVIQRVYSEDSPVTATDTVRVLDTIDRELAAGRPAILGVDHDQKFDTEGKRLNPDQATDHWLVVTSRSYEDDGTVVYTAVDNATPEKAGSVTKLYVSADLSQMYKPANPWVNKGGVASRQYTATNARPTVRMP